MNDVGQRPVEVTTRYATSVPDISAAWAFVMSKVDAVGADPSVRISPVWVSSIDPDRDGTRHFEVVVEGMVEEGAA